MTSFNPIDFFSVGREIGKTNSLVATSASGIRNVLDRANKLGLVQAQSAAQGAEARQTAIFKDTLDNSRNNEMVDQLIIGPGGQQSTTQVRRGDPRPVTEPATNAFTPIPPTTPTSVGSSDLGAEFRSKSLQELKELRRSLEGGSA